MRVGLCDRFQREFAAWERRRKEIVQRFRETLTERKQEMRTTLKRNFEDTNAKLQEAVIIELLKAFP